MESLQRPYQSLENSPPKTVRLMLILPLCFSMTTTLVKSDPAAPPCPAGCYQRSQSTLDRIRGRPGVSAFTWNTYVHSSCYTNAKMCSHGGRLYWTATAQLGDSRTSRCPGTPGKDICFSLQTHYGLSDGGGMQDEVRQAVLTQVKDNWVQMGKVLQADPTYAPNQLTDQVRQALSPLDFSHQIITSLNDTDKA